MLLLINSRGKHNIGHVIAWLVCFRERFHLFLHCLFLKGIWYGNVCHLGVLAFFTFELMWRKTITLSKQIWNSSYFKIKILCFSKKTKTKTPNKTKTNKTPQNNNKPKQKTPTTNKKPTHIQKNPSKPFREIYKHFKDAQIEAVWLKKKSTIVVALNLAVRF